MKFYAFFVYGVSNSNKKEAGYVQAYQNLLDIPSLAEAKHYLAYCKKVFPINPCILHQVDIEVVE